MSSLRASQLAVNPSQLAPTRLQQVHQSLQQQLENGKEFFKQLTTKQLTDEQIRLLREEEEDQIEIEKVLGPDYKPLTGWHPLTNWHGLNGAINRAQYVLRQSQAANKAIEAAPDAMKAALDTMTETQDTMSLGRKALMIFLGLVVVLLIAWIVFKSVSVNQRNRYLNRN